MPWRGLCAPARPTRAHPRRNWPRATSATLSVGSTASTWSSPRSRPSSSRRSRRPRRAGARRRRSVGTRRPRGRARRWRCSRRSSSSRRGSRDGDLAAHVRPGPRRPVPVPQRVDGLRRAEHGRALRRRRRDRGRRKAERRAGHRGRGAGLARRDRRRRPRPRRSAPPSASPATRLARVRSGWRASRDARRPSAGRPSRSCWPSPLQGR